MCSSPPTIEFPVSSWYNKPSSSHFLNNQDQEANDVDSHQNKDTL